MLSDSAVFVHDYVDPLSYLVHRIMVEEAGEAFATSGTGMELIAMELRPPPEAFLAPDDPDFAERWAVMEDELGRGVADRPIVIPWTRKAHELRALAESKEIGHEVHHGLFRAFFEEGQDIGRVDVLVSLAASAGLDRSETKAVLDVDKFAGPIEEERRRALGMGLSRAPAVVAGDERMESWEGRDAVLRCLASLRHP
jgi:predicted DsbA family dithiol-disulfide isomerase